MTQKSMLQKLSPLLYCLSIKLPTTKLYASMRHLLYNVHTLWLFTASDFKTTLAPSIMFAVLHHSAAPIFGLRQEEISFQSMIVPITVTLLWIWVHLLAFCVSNQRLQGSVLEDTRNKPWRPLPSKRLTIVTASRLCRLVHPLAVGLSLYLGGLPQSLGLVVFGYGYNDLGGGDRSIFFRNTLNAGGFTCFVSGALEVLSQSSRKFGDYSVEKYSDEGRFTSLGSWLAIIAAVVATTVQVQDLPDQVGDGERNRKTIPLVLGDGLARWTVSVPMAAWGLACPRYWHLSGYATAVFGGLAFTVAVRTLIWRNISADRMTFLIWNLWMVNLYLLPLLSYRDTAEARKV
jgi:hypothetical protein